MKNTFLILSLFFTTCLHAQWPRSEYNNPNYENCNNIIRIANDIESQANYYISGDDSKRNRIKNSRQEYKKALQVYKQAEGLNCVNSDELKFKIIFCLNQMEQFDESKKILDLLIDSSSFSRNFFNSYFMTENKVSRIKELKVNGFLYYSCGGSLDAIDSEHYYSKEILNNASKLYRKKKYNLILHYFHHSKIRINWSNDTRLNRINSVLSQLLINSLLEFYTIEEIAAEFQKATLVNSDFDFDGIGESMNYPWKKIKVYNYVFNIYLERPSIITKHQKEKSLKPIIDYNHDTEQIIKEKTILYEQIQKMLSITIDKK